MSIEEIKDIVRRYLAGGRQNWEAVVDLGRMKVVDTPGMPDTYDVETLLQHGESDNPREFFENLSGGVQDMIAEENKVVVRWTMVGTAKKPFKHPLLDVTVPVGTTISRRGVSIFTLDGGKVIEERTYEDRLGVLEQLGLAPTLQ
ncbi:ester cyclase [Nonomuraea sp. SYSU D8015]|uniref:ester cyclase n=1 Tax=Nonomuraea sp. SYSU D8015 TaxID=2593644 RepID=UPI001660E9D8|nr:ester cyclase [Nonomuraea sp. SYSU D8015]